MADQIATIIERANSALIARDFAYAEKLLVNLLRQQPDAPEALIALGTVYTRADRWENALSVYKKLSEIDGENVDVLNNLGIIYRRLGRFDESIEALTLAKKTGKDTVTVLYNLGNTYKQMGKYAEAALCFNDVIDQKPDDVLAYNHLGSIHALSGRQDLALQAYRRGLQIDPNHPFIHYNMAHCYESLSRPSEAIAEYNAALKTKPGWLDALRDLSALYARQKNEQSSVATLRRILAVDPSDSRALTEMGNVAARAGHADEALAYFRKAINSDAASVAPVLALVQLFERQGNYDGALQELKTVAAGPNASNADILTHLARLYVRQQQYPEARAVFAQIEKTDHDNVAMLRIKGRMFAQLGNNEESELCFARILAISPTEIDFRIDLADQLMQSGKLSEAEEQLLAYLNERPRDSAVRISLGQLYERMGENSKALAAYKDVLAREPENLDARAALSLLYQRTGRNAEAVRLADEIVNMQGSRGTEEDLSNLSNSLELYENAVHRFGSTNPDALGRNIELLRSKSIPDSGLGEAELTPTLKAGGEGFVPVDEESDPLTLIEDEEFVDDSEIPFDELLATTGEEEPEDVPPDDSFESLVNFEEPMETGGTEGFSGDSLPDSDLQLPIDHGQAPITEEAEEPDFSSPRESPPGGDQYPREPEAPQYQPPQQPQYPQQPQQPPQYPPQPQYPQQQLPQYPQYPQPPQYPPQPQPQYPPEPRYPERPYQPEPPAPKDEKPVPPLSFGETCDEMPSFMDDSTLMENIDLSQPAIEAEEGETVSLEEGEEGAFGEGAEAAPDDGVLELGDEAPEEAPAEPCASPEEVAPRRIAGNPARAQELRDKYGFPIGAPMLSPPEYEEMLTVLNGDELLDLFSYLKDVTRALPADALADYLLSDERIQMEYVIDRLSGKPGLKQSLLFRARQKRVGDERIWPEIPRNILPAKINVRETLEFLETLVGDLPDQGFAVPLKNRLENIRARFEGREE